MGNMPHLILSSPHKVMSHLYSPTFSEILEVTWKGQLKQITHLRGVLGILRSAQRRSIHHLWEHWRLDIIQHTAQAVVHQDKDQHTVPLQAAKEWSTTSLSEPGNISKLTQFTQPNIHLNPGNRWPADTCTKETQRGMATEPGCTVYCCCKNIGTFHLTFHPQLSPHTQVTCLTNHHSAAKPKPDTPCPTMIN